MTKEGKIVPAKLGKEAQDELRGYVDSKVLIARLTAFVKGEHGDDDKPVKLTTAQVSAALGLLRKTLPDLSAVEVDNGSKKTLSESEVLKRLAELVQKHPQLLEAAGAAVSVPAAQVRPPVGSSQPAASSQFRIPARHEKH